MPALQLATCDQLQEYEPSNPADPSAMIRALECSNRSDLVEAIKAVYAAIEESDRRQLPTLYAVISAYSLFLLLGAAGNALVIGAVLCNRRMRTARNLYITNLALSDLVLCAFTQPLNIVRLFQRYNGWQFGLALCKLVNTLTGVNVFVSTYAIITIAFDRFQVINRVGWRPDDKHRRRRTTCWIAAVWLLAFMLSAPLAWFATITETRMPHDNNRLHPLCTELTTEKSLKFWKLVYSGVALLFQYLVPLCALSVAYGLLCRRLNQKVRRRGQAPAMVTDYQRQRARVERCRGRRANVLLTVIAVAFAVAWLPLTINNVYQDIADMRVGVGGNATSVSASELEDEDEENQHLPMQLLNLQGYGQADGGAGGGGGGSGGSGGGGIGGGSVGRVLAAEFAPLLLILLPACLNPLLYGFLNTAFRSEFRRAFARLGVGGGLAGGGHGGNGGGDAGGDIGGGGLGGAAAGESATNAQARRWQHSGLDETCGGICGGNQGDGGDGDRTRAAWSVLTGPETRYRGDSDGGDSSGAGTDGGNEMIELRPNAE